MTGVSEVAGAHELLERWSAWVPDRTAVIHASREATYHELNERAEFLATRLRASGVKPEVVVGLLLNRSIELIVAVLAVWKAGGAFVPLCPSHPPNRTAFILADTQAAVVLTDRDPTGLLPGYGEQVLRVDGIDAIDNTVGTGMANYAPRACPDRRNLAYVLYTSGSTGVPKGALIEQGGVVNLADALQRLFGDLETARVFQFAPVSFDAWVWELAMSVLNGGTLCLPPDGVTLTGHALARVLSEYHVTHFSATPSLIASLPVDGLSTVRTLVAGGEVLPEFLVARWGSRVRLFNAYGPTEVTVCATAGRCEDLGGPKPSIGWPLHHVDVHVVDQNGHPVLAGAVGELWVGGDGVARGYLKQASLTEERFIPDHLSGRPGARLYRTGDLARWLPDGRLDFVGRIDRQIKIRGYRIEPAEVEEALRRHPRISGAVVSVFGADKLRRLVAHIEVPSGEPVPVPELHAFLRPILPDYMVPSVFVTLAQLPLTTHGKVDRDALPAPQVSRPILGHDYMAPRGTVERELTVLWMELLGLDQVGTTDEFFSLGGTSLELLRMQEKIAERWNVHIPLADLVRAHNVRLLAHLLSGVTIAEPDTTDPVSSQQRRLQVSARLRVRRQV
jgi:amino acid adenylation domain-containing protein